MSQACMSTENHSPIGVMWKTVSEACNLACDYCYYSSCGGQPEKITRIEDELLEKFIEEYMALTNGVASFAWQGGEPLLAGIDFFQRVVSLQARYAPRNTIISNSIQSNALLITNEWARFFKKFQFLVGVSLDGPKEIHDRRRITAHGYGSYDRVMRGIRHLQDNRVAFNILTVLHEDNINQPGKLMEFYLEEGYSHVQYIPCMDFRAQKPNQPPRFLITPEQYGDFLCKTFDLWYNDGKPVISIRFFDNLLSMYVHREAESCVHRESCPKTLILERNGDAYPCDFYIGDEYKIGNVSEDSLQDILDHPVYDEFLKLKPTLPEKCKSCECEPLCHGGCPRNRLWDQGNQFPSPDYFCKSYLKVYEYGHERMVQLANSVKAQWLAHYLKEGHPKPNRNSPCLCGSGRKFKKCCEQLI